MSPNQLLLSFALRYPRLIICTIILGFSTALFNGVSTTLIVPLVLVFLGQANIKLDGGPPFIRKALSFLDAGGGNNQIMTMFAIVILAIILKNITGYINSLVSSHLSRRLVNDLRQEGLKVLLEIDLDYYAKSKVGDIVNKISDEVGRTAGAIRLVIQVFTTSITVLTFLFILLSISWKLTIASTSLLLVVTAINQFFVKRAKSFGKILSEQSRAYSTALLEMLTGIRLIKSVSQEEAEYRRIKKLIAQRERADFQSQALFAAIGPINEVAGIMAILAIVFLGKVFFLQEIQSLSTVLLIYLAVLFRLLPFVSQLNGLRSGFANVAPSTEVVANFLRRDNKPFMPNGQSAYTSLKQGIRLEKVSFAYPGHEDLVLREVDLWVPKGTTLALVGASGAGKSTLADLLPRFYDPVEGRIALDGKDLREFDIPSLRGAMGIVSQDTFLFNTSVRNNIAYGREDASFDEIVAAARRANALEFIEQLPQGFDTELGDRGIILSGGQRQRIAIARALLRNPDILILDEATSALDTVSERLVQKAIDELCRDRTTVVIAHRLSTIQKANQIAVLDKGRVVEIGTHEGLLKKGGYYSRLYSMQFERNTEEAIDDAVNEALVQTSYTFRTDLNPLMGFLRLVVDGLVDNNGERQELTEEAYRSAVRLLRNLERLEENSKLA